MVRHVAAHGSAGQVREEAEPERRLLLGVDVLHARHSNRSLHADLCRQPHVGLDRAHPGAVCQQPADPSARDRKSTRLNSSHSQISYAVFCLKKKKKTQNPTIKTPTTKANTDYTTP